ncbi:putative esterase [Arthrobacter silviterrae]|uniref:Acetylesterase n=1 Tax=Arthrobacter silviterrae TaxID=2026658 RepID=A0ABX0DH35_9MICC|nr:acetylxylan esterase [Arthrobacter silviterrae]MDQ0277873.1 putative esterase [Arthrobacter silviterrae]NGN85071.1 acetylesterase [Arthrobacter silviterrae]
MKATQRPSAIPGYEDWPGYVRSQQTAAVPEASGPLAAALGVPAPPPKLPVTVDWEDTHRGVTTSQLGWQLGFGPATRAWLVKPSGDTGPLPGVLALHCHAGNKYTGASRLVDFPPGRCEPRVSAPDPGRHDLYGGLALATELARDGFAVLAHDTFGWGSRRFNLGDPPWRTAAAMEGRRAQWREEGRQPSPAEEYNAAAAFHEETVAKAAGLLGTSLAGTAAHDDLAALSVLSALPGVDPERLGCLGFSGGGGRALVLSALSPAIRSYVVTAMMTTFESLVPAYLDAHSWLLQTPGLSLLGDWPSLTALAGAEKFLVQYGIDDPLFPETGMREADRILAGLHGGAYTGSFWPAGHEFSAGMQREALAFLAGALA